MINKLPLNLSVYLNLLRIVAILGVVLISARDFLHLPLFGTGPLFGNEAAMVLFVISGFLTQYHFKEHKPDRRAFVISRASRIYAAAFVSLIICFGLDFLGHAAKAPYYAELARSGLYSPVSLLGFMQYLTFTHEAWIFHTQMGTMTTYWALGYIVMFYVFFGFTAFRRRRFPLLAVLWFFLVGAPLALYLAVWFIGVETYNFMKKHRQALGPDMALYLFVFSFILFFACVIFVGPGIASPLQQPASPLAILMGYLYHLAIALLVALNLICFERLFRYMAVPSIEAEATVQWLAGANITLYLVHPTLMATMAAFYPKLTKDPVLGVLAVIVTLMLCLLIAEIGERRRKNYTNFFRKLFR
jgi:hypothetical protein